MFYLTLIGVIFLAWLILVFLFTPGINYRLERSVDVHSDDFLHLLESTCQSPALDGNSLEILANGANFYPAMLAAISSATRSVTLEAYIFRPGTIADRFVDALVERAQAGVRVMVNIDAIGSLRFFGEPLRRLREAGCSVQTYQTLKWHTLARLNNRTHRELLIVDGVVGFVGGAGIADWWARASGGWRYPWRDTMVRVEGPIVSVLQGVFAENWLESCGEILTSHEYFSCVERPDGSTVLVVKSSPADRATVARVAVQLLIQGAQHEVWIATPYFLPDRSLRRALTETARRGVKITVIVPGANTDQRWVRLTSRRWYGSVLKVGVRICEYEPSMLHMKILVVDTLWSVVGTTNIDNRSFEHNDEVNLAICDPVVAQRLIDDFEADLINTRVMTYERWQQRPWWEKVLGPFNWILERQQ